MSAAKKTYTIVYANDAFADFNLKNAKFLNEATGMGAPISADDEGAETTYEILLGHVARDESRALYASADAPEQMHYSVCVKGTKLVIAGYDYFSTKQAILYVADRLAAGVAVGDIPACTNVALLEAFPPQTAAFRAMEYNILVEFVGWGCGGLLDGPVQTRVEPLTAIIRGYSPDVLCLCEVFERWGMCLPMWLCDRYQFVCLNRDDGFTNRTVLAFKKETMRLLDCGYEDIAVVKTINRRAVVWAHLQDRASGKRFLVAGTHWEVTSDEDRQKQAVMMPEILAALRERFGGVPVLAMGDFNCKPTSTAYQMFVENSGMKDIDDDLAIDHIFITDGVEIKTKGREMGHYTEYASDHKPVWCDFELN